jgi:branched-chain amino acid transport system substrate-binding protein
MLTAISTATDDGRRDARRAAVLAAIFDTRDRHSVLGTYGIDRDGDTTIHRYGVYTVRNGTLRFWKTLIG